MRRDRQKITIMALALLALLVLAACGPNNSPPSNPRMANSTSPAPAAFPTADSTLRAPAALPTANSAPPTAPALPEPDFASSAGSPVALAYNPADGSLLKADPQGLFRWHASTGWESVTLPQAAGASAVVVNPDQPATVYASGLGLGVVRSDDGGENWQVANTGLPDLDVTALALHSFRRETLFAWLEGIGTYRTEDGGQNWGRIPDQGPPDTNVRGLTHSTLPGSMNTGWLYAATPTGTYLSMDCF